MYADDNHHGGGYEPNPAPSMLDVARAKLAAMTPFEKAMTELRGQRWTAEEASQLKDEIDAATDHRKKYREADDAANALACRGFALFRNGRVLSPARHTITEEEHQLFDTLKAAYPHAKLL